MKIRATDLNPQYLDRARAGTYQPSSLKELPEKFKHRYFREITNKRLFCVKAFLKDGILWNTHNFLTETPDHQFTLIFLRNNLLTYYNDVIKMSALNKVTDTLIEGGFLIIGSHEKLPSFQRVLIPLDALPYVLRKQSRATGYES